EPSHPHTTSTSSITDPHARPSDQHVRRWRRLSEERDKPDGPDEKTKRRNERLWRIGTVVALIAWALFLAYIYEDPGPICGTGQDKGPC
ncbi:hypothetical protein, partial [Streptomyces antibioticus]|uniref:hypothetical protein n=1 Tax=Streptomyces antibioticus TaxID=1890 RepID=UPI0033D66013